MAYLEIRNIKIKGISAAVPQNRVLTRDSYKPEWGNVDDFIESTHIVERRVADENICTSDLCVGAAEELISALNWDKSEIEAIVFVTQTPDFLCCPATACTIQSRLGLPESCMAFDISLGCSGWVYGMSVLAALMQNGTIKKGLLLAGDTATRHNSTNDGSATPLFGDAGTVTALEFDPNWESTMRFSLNTDGTGWDAIVIREGGYRTPFSEESLIVKDCGEGHYRRAVDVEMDGMSVFSFAISKVPKTLKALMERNNISDNSIDQLTLHQANRMINSKIVKKIKIDPSKMPESLPKYGNTSSASIPLTLVTESAEILRNSKIRHLASGFGVGLSWGGVLFETENLVIPEVIEI